MKNKLLLLLTMVSMIFVFSGCSNANSSSVTGGSSAATPGGTASNVISDLISGGKSAVSDMK